MKLKNAKLKFRKNLDLIVLNHAMKELVLKKETNKVTFIDKNLKK
jgi:hypothetical protein